MLSKEELKLINEVFESLELDGEKDKLKKKISLINKQLEVMEKAQEETAKIQDEIVALEGDGNGKKEN